MNPVDAESRHRFLAVSRDFVQAAQRNDGLGMAAEMAYHWMLALLPTIAFLFACFAWLDQDRGWLYDVMQRVGPMLPAPAKVLLDGALNDISAAGGGMAFWSLLGVLWAGSHGAAVVEKAVNRAYQCSTVSRSFVQQRWISVWIVLGMAVILLGLSNVAVFGEWGVSWLSAQLALAPVARWGVSLLRWGVPLLVLWGMMGVLYRITPADSRYRSWRTAWPGAVVFSAVWIGGSWLFSVYVASMGQFNRVYGSIGAVVVLMVWLYWTSLGVVLGAHVNAWLAGCGRPPTDRS